MVKWRCVKLLFVCSPVFQLSSTVPPRITGAERWFLAHTQAVTLSRPMPSGPRQHYRMHDSRLRVGGNARVKAGVGWAALAQLDLLTRILLVR